MTIPPGNTPSGADDQNNLEADRLRREALAALRRNLSAHPDFAHIQDFINEFDGECVAQRAKLAVGEKRDEASHDDEEGDFGRFTLQRLLGEGGFGVVFCAHDPQLGRNVAVKLPRVEIWSTAELYRRFMREGRAVAILNHPNIIPVYESGEILGVGYIVTAYCSGRTLAEWITLDASNPCSPRVAADLVMQIARAVQHAHDYGVLHRDIKPANILLENRMDEAGVKQLVPLLTDFGLAKDLNDVSNVTMGDAQAGTPRYMAPEQLRDDGHASVGISTDIYGLGVVLYELLAGAPPFDDENQLVLARKIRDEAALPLRNCRPDVPRDLETICFKCLEKEPARRYLSARELADDLKRFLDGDEVTARPLSFASRWGRRCRKHRLVTTLCALLSVATLAGLGGVVYQWRSANLYAAAVEASLIQAEQGLVNMSWIVEEMNRWSSNTDPFYAGNGERLRRYYERMLSRPAPLRPSLAYEATMQSFHARVAELDNRPDEAESYFEQSIHSWVELVHLEPDDNDYRQALAANLFSYGAHLRRHNKMDRPLAQPYEEKVLYDYLLKLAPDNGSIVGDFTSYLMERGKALSMLGQPRAAHAQFRLANGLLGHALTAFPQDERFRWLWGQSKFCLACSTRRVGSKRDAIEQFTDSNIIFEEMMAQQKAPPECLLYRAEASRLQAACMRDAGDQDLAVTMYETAFHFLTVLQDRDERSPALSNLFASTTMNLAELYEKQGKPDHARLNWQRFCEFCGAAVQQRSAADAYAERLPRVLLNLAKHDVEEGREGDAVGRLILASQVAAYLSPLRDADATLRLDWAECLALRADIAVRLGKTDEAIVHHRAAIDVLDIPVSDSKAQTLIREQVEQHKNLISQLQTARES
jgi:serine/threonine protein kinase